MVDVIVGVDAIVVVHVGFAGNVVGVGSVAVVVLDGDFAGRDALLM